MEFRNVRIDEYEKVKTFFEEYFGEGFFEVERKNFFWLHGASPHKHRCATKEEFTSFAAFDGEEIAACIHYYPVDFYVEGTNFPSCITAGLRAKEEYPGLAGLLMRRYLKKTHYHLSMGDTRLTGDMLKAACGCEYQHNIGRAILASSRVRLAALLAQGPVAPEVLQGLGKWVDNTEKAALKGRWKRIDSPEDLRDDYWTAHLQRSRATVERSPEYMAWRFFGHPHLKYDVISPDTAQKNGIAIIRREQIGNTGAMVGRMIEFLPTRGGETTLGSCVAAYAKDNDLLFLDFFCGSRNHLENTLHPPFLLERDHEPYHFPRLFQPLEWRERTSLNASFGLVKKRDGVVVGLDEVYFTKGDGSQDVWLNPNYKTRGF